jgi:DNA (cytosine-5)-methyltransferase 1
LILSLFSGCGGLDLGFEQAGFDVGLAFDISREAVDSWNRNRLSKRGHVADISKLRLADLDKAYGAKFLPTGVIGGPPCQSFSRANSKRSDDDPRNELVHVFFSLALRIHRHRRPLDFIVMENVPDLRDAKAGTLLSSELERLQSAGFNVTACTLDAAHYDVPQYRRRMFVVAVGKSLGRKSAWAPPNHENKPRTIAEYLSKLPEPAYFSRDLKREAIPSHPNHWCMSPKSSRFFDGSLKQGYSSGRSFKTLSWDEPSITVSYGNREVHVHPNGHRRLSVFEAMRLQGFPDSYVLEGTLSSQISQISDAVPPPLAYAVAHSLTQLIVNSGRQSRLAKCSSSVSADAV